MDRARHLLLLGALLLLPACALQPAAMLRQVRPVNPDGSLAPVLAEGDLSPFQTLLRDRIPARPPQPKSIFAMETDLPEGAADAGDYLAVVRWETHVELRYHEQIDRRPRYDRFYQRPLTAGETQELEAFLKAHPLAGLTRPRIAGTMPAAQPATRDAGGAVLPVEPGAEPSMEAAAAEAVEWRERFRFTDARPGQTHTLAVEAPAEGDPAADLVRMLRRFRDTASFTCVYFQPIPPTAQSLYADPYRRVLFVWYQEDDLRILVTRTPSETDANSAEWLARKSDAWKRSEPPPTFATVPTSAPATEPEESTTPETLSDPALEAPPETEPGAELATPSIPEPLIEPTEVEPALEPFDAAAIVRSYMRPADLPVEETWWAEPQDRSTMVRHYVPVTTKSGMTLGFVVPAFEFDSDHFAVDGKRGVLYLIHDGQLFSLPIPGAALKP